MAIKVRRGGKHANQLYGNGYFGRNDAGTAREKGQPGAPTNKREFEGSRLTEFTFSDKIHGTRTIVAKTYEEALRIAETLGFSKQDYEDKKRRRKTR